MSGDEVLIKTFKEGGDVHSTTAAKVFQVPLGKVTSEMRRKAKAINFGIIYGQQAFGLSQGLEITLDEAEDFIDKYFEKYAGVRRWIDATLNEVRKSGITTTLSGRKRQVSEINSSNGAVRGFAERVAINTPIQGTSADIIKAAMIKVHEELAMKNMKSKMLVQVHDELLFEVPEKELTAILPIIKDGMETAFQLKVPLVVDIKQGHNWNDMEKVAA
jgi:DNA polymerase-1